jgi:hypothetical protein
MAASALVHLSILTGIVLFAEVHPFGSVTAETIAVDIVSPEEAEPIPDKADDAPPPKPSSDAFDVSMKAGDPGAAASKPQSPSQPSSPSSQPPSPSQAQPPSQPQNQPQPQPQKAAAQPQKQAALATPRADPQPAAVEPPSPSPPQAPPPAPSTPTSTTPAYVPPEPDLSIKYHVMLGLPLDLPQPEGQSHDKSGDGYDAPALKEADLAPGFVAAFRSHLKTCSKLPASVAASDNLKIKLRVFMTPDGKLAAAPILIEASASAKGPLLMQSAISALQACQPYDMLPADRYGEWKELDLSFSPQDFTGAS